MTAADRESASMTGQMPHRSDLQKRWSGML